MIMDHKIHILFILSITDQNYKLQVFAYLVKVWSFNRYFFNA